MKNFRIESIVIAVGSCYSDYALKEDSAHSHKESAV